MSSVPWIQKDPEEEFPRGFDFAEALAEDENLTDGTASAIEMDTGLDVSADLLADTTVTPVGTTAGVVIVGGEDCRDYEISIKMTTSLGQTLKEKIVVQVRGHFVAIPGGGGGLGGGVQPA